MQLRHVTTCLLACVAFACGGGRKSEDAQETIILRVAHNGSEQHAAGRGKKMGGVEHWRLPGAALERFDTRTSLSLNSPAVADLIPCHSGVPNNESDKSDARRIAYFANLRGCNRIALFLMSREFFSSPRFHSRAY